MRVKSGIRFCLQLWRESTAEQIAKWDYVICFIWAVQVPTEITKSGWGGGYCRGGMSSGLGPLVVLYINCTGIYPGT